MTRTPGQPLNGNSGLWLPGSSDWRYRAIRATHDHRGNRDLIGCIVLAICNKFPRTTPRIWLQRGAAITIDGDVVCDMELAGRERMAMVVCDVEDLTNNFRKLADHLKLADDERLQMFAELKKWIRKDHRAKSTLE